MKWHVPALVVGLILSGCQETRKPPPPDATVLVAPPLRQRVVDWDDYVGRFESIDAVELRPRVGGYLQSVAFRDGAFVRRGQLLFVIDPRPYQATLAQATAQVARARATLANAGVELRRAQALVAARAASQQELETRRAAALQARADLAAAQATARAAALNVEFTRIRAPLSGRASDRRVAPGNLVSADTTVLTSIVNLDPIRFSFEAPESLYLRQQRQRAARGGRAGIGDPVEIRLSDEAAYHWHGRLEFIDNALDVNSGVIRGRAVIPNPRGLLTPGMFGHMRLPGSGAYDALLVPDAAIAPDQNREVVLIVDAKGMVRQRAVQIGPLVNGLRVVRGGLRPDDRVIISGAIHAKPGKHVNAKAGRITPGRARPTAPDYVAPAASSASPA